MKKLTPKKIKEVSKDKIVNLNLYKIKKTLTEEGFEVIENKNGNLKLIIKLPDTID